MSVRRIVRSWRIWKYSVPVSQVTWAARLKNGSMTTPRLRTVLDGRMEVPLTRIKPNEHLARRRAEPNQMNSVFDALNLSRLFVIHSPILYRCSQQAWTWGGSCRQRSSGRRSASIFRLLIFQNKIYQTPIFLRDFSAASHLSKKFVQTCTKLRTRFSICLRQTIKFVFEIISIYHNFSEDCFMNFVKIDNYTSNF